MPCSVKLIRNADGGFLSVRVAVVAEEPRIHLRMIGKYLPHHLVGYTAGGGIAVVLPVVSVKRNKGQHIYRCFKR